MKTALRNVICIAAVLSISGVARAGEPDLRRIFQVRYAAMHDASSKRDAEAFAKLLAPGFVSTALSGKSEDAPQMLAELRSMPVGPKKESGTTVEKVRVEGGTAYVEQSYSVISKTPGPNGITQDTELRTLSEDTWIKSNGTWLCKSTKTKQLDLFAGGRNVLHKTRGENP